MLKKLTKKQQAQLPHWRDKWIAIGLSTDRADWDRAEQALRACYRHAQLDEPKLIVPTASPLLAVQAGPIADLILGTPDLRRRAKSVSVKSTLTREVCHTLHDAVACAVFGALKEHPIVPPQRSLLIEEVLQSSAAQKAFSANWIQYLGGRFWASWSAFESFFREVCQYEFPLADRARDCAEMTQSSCWIWPHREFATVSDRPCVLHRDDAGQLHSLDGAAIQWVNGWGVYAVHGTVVPSDWIEQKDQLDPTLALTHANVELRRAAAEIVGWDAVLAHVPTTVVDTDDNPQIGTLLRADLPDAPGSQFLRVQCGTGRVFVLSVPPDCRTALQANAWTYDMTEDVFKLFQART